MQFCAELNKKSKSIKAIYIHALKGLVINFRKSQWTHCVVSTSLRRLYDVADVIRRLIDVDTSSCVYWDGIIYYFGYVRV